MDKNLKVHHNAEKINIFLLVISLDLQSDFFNTICFFSLSHVLNLGVNFVRGVKFYYNLRLKKSGHCGMTYCYTLNNGLCQTFSN